MRLAVLGVSHVLLISILCTAQEIKKGCMDWKLEKDGLVRCLRCNPGNRLVAERGTDPSVLCEPCSSRTFTVEPLSRGCSSCTQCIGPQVELQACTASSDTVCGCKPGLRCGDKRCTFCTDECKEGEEPTDKRSCRKCPDRTFNDKIHSPCKPWRKSCPEGEVLIANGNAFSDIKCSSMRTTPIPNEFNTVDTLPVGKKPDESILPVGVIVGGISAAFGILILSLWLAVHRTNSAKSTTEYKKPKAETIHRELTIMVVEHDEACSFHQPEQEHGGSSETISTQDSETKLIV